MGDALIAFYLHLDPDALDDDEWARRVNQVQFGLRTTQRVHGLTKGNE